MKTQAKICLFNLVFSLMIIQILSNLDEPLDNVNLTSKEIIAEKFNEFKVKFHKEYNTTEEDERRRDIFAENLRKIKLDNDIAGYQEYVITQYADLTVEEMYRHTGFVPINPIP